MVSNVSLSLGITEKTERGLAWQFIFGGTNFCDAKKTFMIQFELKYFDNEDNIKILK